MYRKIRRRLTLLFTLFTSVILAAALCIAYHLSLVKSKNHHIESLNALTDTIASQIQSTYVLTNSMICQLEQEKCCMIYLEDGGYQVTLKEGYHSSTDRTTLFESLRYQAAKDGFSLNNSFNNTNNRRSKLYHVNGCKHDTYYGYVVVIPGETSSQTLMILYSLDQYKTGSLHTKINYMTIAVVSCLLLFLLSYYFIGKILREIDENNKKQTEFVACASHELRSPLAYIKAANSTLAKECLPFMNNGPKKYLTNYITNTEGECTRMSSLIEDMLLLASADSKTWTIHTSEVDMDLFFIDCYEKLSVQCVQQKHHLILDLPDEMLGTFLLDSSRMYQIIQILVNNAISYSKEGTTISLAASTSHNKDLRIQVIDHGIGLNSEQKKRIFDRYYRVDKAHSDRTHFGLGLNIAKELVRLQGGKITVLDTDGGGTTFCMRFSR